MTNHQKVFYVAAYERDETPYTFWSGTITIDPGLDIDELRIALVAKYGAHSGEIFKPRESDMLNPTTAKARFPDRATLEQRAIPVNDDELIRNVVTVRRSLVVLVRPSSFGASVPRSRLDPEAADVVSQLQQDFTKYVQAVRSGPTPSTAAKSTDYYQIQGSDVPLFDGRLNDIGPLTAAPPIELYHPVFQAFSRRSRDPKLSVPHDVICLTAKLLRSVSKISVREARRDKESRDILSAILDVSYSTVTNQDRTSADYMTVQGTPMSRNAAPNITEVKGELGLGGSDPSVQVSFSYAKFYCSEDCTPIREACCCPAFLVGLAGPWIVILGAILTSRVIVQRLSAYEWLGCSRILDDRQVLQVAHHLYSLRLAIKELKMYYENLVPPSALAPGHLHPRFFPYINSFTHDNHVVSFVYEKPLERDPSSVTFKAIRNDNGSPIVVKFARRYGKDAHEWLASRKLAPWLLSFTLLQNCDDMSLVVMEYLDGQTLHDVYGETAPLPAEVRKSVQKALDVLGERGFVFGDLRRPNVMLVNGKDDVVDRIRLIDFDWAGKESSDLRYPFHLSRVVRDASGATDYDEIKKVHQENMFNKL